MKKYRIEVFEKAEDFILGLPEKERAKILAHISIMQEGFSGINTRLLKNPIRELKVKNYRVLFFIKKDTVYLVSSFIKKSQKTPLQEIEYAQEIYKKLK